MNNPAFAKSWTSDIATALGLLGRLPLPASHAGLARGAQAAWAYPVAGLVLGGLAACAGALAVAPGLPAPLAALISLTALILLTGALHEDGLADTADGLGGGWNKARRLEIMKDSHIGSYGTIALLLSLLARWAALWLLFDAGTGRAVLAILTAAAISRAMLSVLMWALPHARATGLSHAVGRVARPAMLGALGIAAVTALLLCGWAGLGALLWAALATLILGRIAKAKIGGQTGDILGAAQQVSEIAVLFALLA